MTGPDTLTLRQLVTSRFTKVPRKPDFLVNGLGHLIKTLCEGREKDDQILIDEFLNRVDVNYLNNDKASIEEAF